MTLSLPSKLKIEIKCGHMFLSTGKDHSSFQSNVESQRKQTIPGLENQVWKPKAWPLSTTSMTRCMEKKKQIDGMSDYSRDYHFFMR